MTRAVVLARGLGTRMRAADPIAQLTPDQQQAADAGLKPMIPVSGRPFLDYVLGGLADAVVTDVALVVPPDHELLRHYYTSAAPPSRVTVSFVVQPEPRGTADAVLASERWTKGDAFLVLNGDNLYPTAGLRALAQLDEPGLLAFEREDLVRSGNIPPDRVAAFALIEMDNRGYLTRILEKPSSLSQHAETTLISMNCWRFDTRIFQACRDVPRSQRGEYELPDAVSLAIKRGTEFRAIRARGPVLDLSRRADAVAVAKQLAGFVPRP